MIWGVRMDTGDVGSMSVEDLDEFEELEEGVVERVYYDYKPKVTRVVKPKKVEKLEFRRSFENIREIFD